MTGIREVPCPDCTGHEGYSAEAWVIAGTFYPHMIPGRRFLAARIAWYDKLVQADVDLLREHGYPVPSTAAEVNEWQRDLSKPGLDGLARTLLIQRRCHALGVPIVCQKCDGHEVVPVLEDAHQ